MSVRMFPGALDRLARSAEVADMLEEAGEHIAKRARSNASVIAGPDRTEAIQHEMGDDDEGVFVDVGYKKHHKGFVLWWHEVGTTLKPATPHLRPAVESAGRVTTD